MKRLMLIYNPKAGRGLFVQSLPAIIDIFVKGGYRVETWPTQAQGDAVDKVAAFGEEADMIVAAGGDGTLDEVIEGMFRANINKPLGYIPVGSTNDFAGSLSLENNARIAARSIIKGEARPVDIARFGEEHFVYVAAFGAFTDVAYSTNQDMKNAIGHAAYMVEATKRLMDLKPVHMRIEADNRVIEDDFLVGMCTNSRSVGGIKNITGKDVTLNDGLFELTLVHNPSNVFDLQEIVTSLLSGVPSPHVDLIKADRFVFDSEADIPWTLDGEFGGTQKHVEITVLRQALNLIMTEEQVEKAVDHAVLTDD